MKRHNLIWKWTEHLLAVPKFSLWHQGIRGLNDLILIFLRKCTYRAFISWLVNIIKFYLTWVFFALSHKMTIFEFKFEMKQPKRFCLPQFSFHPPFNSPKPYFA